MSDLVPCGYELYPNGDVEPCPLPEGHEDEHLCWYQLGHGGRWTVIVVDSDGLMYMHIQMSGKSEAEEVSALIEFFKLVAKARE